MHRMNIQLLLTDLYFKIFQLFNWQYTIITVHTRLSLTKTVIILHLCIHLLDDDLVKVETCRRDVSVIIDCEICWI